nr:Uncharacterised protein [Klebsiella pneumoniae]
MYARLFLILLALFSPDAKAQTIQESVAFAIIGEPKYAAGFSHFDYVNPRAPKGGTSPWRRSAPLITSTVMRCAATRGTHGGALRYPVHHLG